MLKHSNDKNHKKEELIPYINKPGIALSFDDSYRVDSWNKYGEEIFGYYDVKVTFNINGVHPLENDRKHTQLEIDKLLELQSNGHEIAHHGLKHQSATRYSEKYGYEKWIKDEIESLISWIDQQKHSKTKEGFKKPVSFAFPHFLFNDEIIKRIIPEYFKITRGHLYGDNLVSFNQTGLAPSICLDGYYRCNIFYLKKIIRLAKKTGKNLILTCHSILPEKIKGKSYENEEKASKWGTWRVTPELIQVIINETRKNGMEFYTTAELAGVATFIDKKLEASIREKIVNPFTRWISIKELQDIKELNLSNKGISNLDGIQYLLNLEKLDLRNNNLSDISLLDKLPNLKEADISNNPVDKKSNKIKCREVFN